MKRVILATMFGLGLAACGGVEESGAENISVSQESLVSYNGYCEVYLGKETGYCTATKSVYVCAVALSSSCATGKAASITGISCQGAHAGHDATPCSFSQ